ncbi:MAG TPA: hypothetical protein VKB43_01485 [Gaiellaceae bacterium]|nr:hypothetical protein [Gaiellaceae bacterium]
MRIKLSLSCVVLALTLAGAALAAGQSSAWRKNTWHENALLTVFHGYFVLGPNTSGATKGFSMTLNYGQDLPLKCTLRLGSKASMRAKSYGEDGYRYDIGFRWPKMSSPAKATVTCHVQGPVTAAWVTVGVHTTHRLRKT